MACTRPNDGHTEHHFTLPDGRAVRWETDWDCDCCAHDDDGNECYWYKITPRAAEAQETE